MSTDVKKMHSRVLTLITMPKLAEKAIEMFDAGAIPLYYKLNASGTATSEIMDMLGLGSTDKTVLISALPKEFAEEMLKKLRKELHIGTTNSGIAFTLALSSVNNHIYKMLMQLENNGTNIQKFKTEESVMAEVKYAMVAAIVNQGYSEEVMKSARSAGAGGGTVINSRRLGNEEAMSFWGLGAQAEKEIVIIITNVENKVNLMQSISENCGLHSNAHGIVLALPVDSVIGLED